MKKALFYVLLITFSFSSAELFAQYFSFGKNRVQYDDFEWRFIQTKHFDVYYYSEKNYKLAEFTAKSIESAYKQLTEDFNHQISNRISVIIYDSHNDFSQTNVVNLPNGAENIGGVTDKLKNRMTIPFTGDYAEFRRVIHHELVHAVFNDMFYGGTINSIISNNIQLVFPLWFEEGLAEYTALGWDTNTDMYVRDAVINNYLPPIQYLSNYFAYRGGQSLWNFIVEEYGRQKIAEILHRIKNLRSVEAGIRQSLGLNLEELSDAWQDALQKRYYPEVAERERADNIANLLTKRGEFGTYNTSPAISPQGDKIAFITNKRGYFDVVVISAINGNKLKTLIKGEDNPEFEELNILNPNITWSPDGSKVALSTKSRGKDDLAIVSYESGKIEKIRFPDLDAIASVAWSPDGQKIALAANIGPYQDIFVYDIPTKNISNLTRDIFSDRQPAWSADSRTVYFVSDRGERTQLGEFGVQYDLLSDEDIYQTDIYEVRLGSDNAVRLTTTPGWNEITPQTTHDGRLIYISDRNGIQNIYELDPQTRTATALTNLQSGAFQVSVSADGSRIAFNSINEGYLDIFLLRAAFQRNLNEEPSPNYWAQRRENESESERVPATRYAREMFADGLLAASDRAITGVQEDTTEQRDTEETEDESEEEVEEEESTEIDFRNYVFSTEVMEDTTLVLEDIENFTPENNVTDDGRFQPKEYRLKFTTDIAYSPTFVASTYGSYALTQFLISDLLGDHQIAIGTNFVTDLRNSDYSLQYGYMKNRLNFFTSYFHTSRRYQTYFGETIRFRTYGGGVSFQYPLDKFRRLDAGITAMNIRRDYNSLSDLYRGASVGANQTDSENSFFVYPEFIYTSDHSRPGFITPQGGSRYSIGISSSPGLGSSSPRFASVLADYRKYFGLGANYSFAIRTSGAASLGRDSQTYFMGGRLGWINQQFSDNGLSFDRLTDSFFTVPALPLRGYAYNSIYGSNFTLINAEFRFPVFAALVPGPLPILPFYNITGVAFFDVGTAWGQQINYRQYGVDENGNEIYFPLLDEDRNEIINEAKLDFLVAKEEMGFYDFPPPIGQVEAPYLDGDILIGAGFGVRAIVFGLPFRYDIGWPYNRTGFKSDPVHYFSIGIDF